MLIGIPVLSHVHKTIPWLVDRTPTPPLPQQSQFSRKLYNRSFFPLNYFPNLVYCQYVHISIALLYSIGNQNAQSYNCGLATPYLLNPEP